LGGDGLAAEDFKRKLTSIFSADVAGYRRLMGEGEAATVKTLETYKQVMFALIKQQRGRGSDSPGCQAHAWVGRYEEAIAAHKKALQRAPDDILTHLALTTAYSWAGRLEEAHAQAAEVLRVNPKLSLEGQAKRLLSRTQEDRERYLEGLRKAGLK
jgi:tetratricopeptide (TPR) repeat protein